MNRTLQSLSQRLPIPKVLSVNSGIISPNSPGGSSGRGISQDASDVCAWPVSVPTCIVAAVLFTVDTGVSGLEYHPLAPESTIDVYCVASLVDIRMANRRSHFRAILLLFLFISGDPCQERRERGPRRKSCWELHFEALYMLLEPRRQVDVGLSDGRNSILHLAGNFP